MRILDRASGRMTNGQQAPLLVPGVVKPGFKNIFGANGWQGDKSRIIRNNRKAPTPCGAYSDETRKSEKSSGEKEIYASVTRERMYTMHQ